MSDQSAWHIYECDSCGDRKVADTPFEADKPIGFWIDLLKVTGEKYPHHAKTPAPVYFCSKECLLKGLQFGISRMTEDIVPIGLDPRQISPWR
jgi:hypothetical protein